LSYTYKTKHWKLEIIISIIALVTVMIFSLDGTREFFLENLLENQYEEISQFKRVSEALKRKYINKNDLLYIESIIDSLEGKDFILKDDVKLLKAKMFEKSGNVNKQTEALEKIIKSSQDELSRIDAIISLSEIYSSQGRRKKAIEILEKSKDFSSSYRKNEINLKLALLNYNEGNFGKSGEYVKNIECIESKYKDIINKIIEKNWNKYTQPEKKSFLKAILLSKDFKIYSLLLKRYVLEYNIPENEVEELTLSLVYNCHQPYVKSFLDFLSSRYESIANEMLDLYNLSKENIRSHSGSVRGAYYYKLIRPFNKKARYNWEKAFKYADQYLKGEIDPQYLKKILSITIRNLLAYQKYELITNLIESSSISNRTANNLIQNFEDISFWNGYAFYQVGEFDRAQYWFERAISIIPDGYFTIHAKTFILEIIRNKEIPQENYIQTIKDKFENSEDITGKNFYGRLLFGLLDNSKRESLKKTLSDLLYKVSNNPLLNFEESILGKLKQNDSYIRFVVYARNGLLDKARAILSAAEIQDPTIQDLLICRELIRNKDFSLSRPYFSKLINSDFINQNFAFLPRDVQTILYPTPYDSEIKVALNSLKDINIDKNLVYSIIRSESSYIPTAKSRAGARGLMQLLPSTVRLISSESLKKRYYSLYNPLFNIILGTKFLNNCIKEYGFLNALASYNGGIRIINTIEKKFSPKNNLELMEIIPYTETREYVKKVISDYYRYQYLYNEENLDLVFLKLIQKKES